MNEEEGGGVRVLCWVSGLKPKPKAQNRKIAKFYSTPNISMFILKKVVNAILDSMEVVSSPNSTVYKK